MNFKNEKLPPKFTPKKCLYIKKRNSDFLEDFTEENVEKIVCPGYGNKLERLETLEKVVSQLIVLLKAETILKQTAYSHVEELVEQFNFEEYEPTTDLERAELTSEAMKESEWYRKRWPELDVLSFGFFKETKYKSLNRKTVRLVNYTVIPNFWENIIENYSTLAAFRSYSPDAYIPDSVKEAFTEKEKRSKELV